jgi:hypothetical protein
MYRVVCAPSFVINLHFHIDVLRRVMARSMRSFCTEKTVLIKFQRKFNADESSTPKLQAGHYDLSKITIVVSDWTFAFENLNFKAFINEKSNKKIFEIEYTAKVIPL